MEKFESESYKKIGTLSEHESSENILSQYVEKSNLLENQIKELEEQVVLLEEEKLVIDKKVEKYNGYISSSTLYETAEGALVAGLPIEHPVIKKIEMNKRMERLSQGLLNVITALKQERENREPVSWERFVEILPEESRELILNDTGCGTHHSLKTPDSIEEVRSYIRETIADIFKETEVPIGQVEILSGYNGDGYGGGFSGVAVFTDARIFGDVYKKIINKETNEILYPPCLFMIAKDGTRYCFLETGSYKTYPQMSKIGPDFAGYGKTPYGRFSFRRMVFEAESSSAEHQMVEGNLDIDTLDLFEKEIKEGNFVDGIDPDTFYDEKTKSIILKEPVFLMEKRPRYF